jgi:KaiC/GvpD/RAD55 family RecA-like ATPase
MTEQFMIRSAVHQHRTLEALTEFGIKEWMLSGEGRVAFQAVSRYLQANDGLWPPELLIVEIMGWQAMPLEDMPGISLRHACTMIVEGHGRSRMMEGINEIVRLLSTPADQFKLAHETLRRISDEVTQVVSGNANSVSLYDLYPIAAERYELIRSGELGIDMPWPTPSKACGGYKLGQFCVLVARPKSYKTWLLLHTALHLRAKGLRVLFISPELNTRELAGRAACCEFKTSYVRYSSGSLTAAEQKAFMNAAFGMKGKGGFDVREDAMRVDKESVTGLVDTLDPDVIVVDSFYKAGEGRDKTAQIVDASDWASRLKSRGRPRLVLVTTQFNRNVDGTEGSVNGDNIFGSDAILQDADMIHGLWVEQEGTVNMRQLAIRDGRWHPDIRIRTDLEKMCFDEVAPEDGPDPGSSQPPPRAKKDVDLSFLEDNF